MREPDGFLSDRRVVFDLLKTRIDGLDAVLGGGIRYPSDTAAFAFVTGGPGTGKSLLALEMVTRAWLATEEEATFLYYSVEQTPDNLAMKLKSDFDYFGFDGEIRMLDREVPNKICLEVTNRAGRARLVITQALPGDLDSRTVPNAAVDLDWIVAEIGNYRLTGPIGMVCIDNVGLLLTDVDYFTKRQKLLNTRRILMSHAIHGIFVQEEANPRDLRIPSAEEFSTDLLIRLGFEELSGFKARILEIQKARHQYYYRGTHQFSIAGRDLQRDRYLGARNERGPGIHIYPSVAAQLSIARDHSEFAVPPRGTEPIDLGHRDLHAAFRNDTGPTAGSSTVLLAEPGTRYTYLALRFLMAGRQNGEKTLMVSTREDPDALARICQREAALSDCVVNGKFDSDFRIFFLHPEFISPGKFTWDLLQAAGSQDPNGPVRRLAFDNFFRLQDRFPLLAQESFLMPALLDLLRYLDVTPLFIDLVPPGSARGGTDFNPGPYLTAFDNVFHLYVESTGDEPRPFLRVLKSMANDYKPGPMPVDYRSS